MAARPPRFAAVHGAGDWIVRRVLPRPVDGTRARGDHHVAGGWSCGAADGGGHVIPATMTGDLGAFLCIRFHVPFFGILPAVVDMLDLAHGAQPVMGELHVVAGTEEQVALAVFAHGVAGVDVFGQLQVDWLAPRPADIVGPDHVVTAVVVGASREIEVVAPFMLDQVRCPDRPHVGGDGVADGLPVDKVARVPEWQPRIGVEGRQGEVVVITVLQHGRIGPVTGQHRIAERAIAQVRLPLVFDAKHPAFGRRLCFLGMQPGKGQRKRQAEHRQPCSSRTTHDFASAATRFCHLG